jgi:hypothetical protein
MRNAFAAEVLKLRTLLLPRLVVGVAAALAAVIGGVMPAVADADHDVLAWRDLLTGPAQPAWFLAAVVAVLATAGESHHHTVIPSLLHVPRRGRLVVAKAGVCAAYGALVAGLASAMTLATGALVASRLGVATTGGIAVADVVAVVGLGALWALLAGGLGLLARSSTVALVGLLLWTFVVENVIPIVTGSQEVQRWLPSETADAVLFRGRPDLLGAGTGAGIFVAYVGAVVLSGSMVLLRRDPT